MSFLPRLRKILPPALLFLCVACLVVLFGLPGEESVAHVMPSLFKEENGVQVGDPIAFGFPATSHEIVAKRTERTATFSVNGKLAAVSWGKPLFTKDEHGQWVPVQESGKACGNDLCFDRLAGGVHARINVLHPGYTLTQDDHVISVMFTATAAGAVQDDHTVDYTLAPGVILRLQVVDDHVVKTISVMQNGPLPDFSFTVTTSEHLLQKLKDNRILFDDSVTGKLVFATQEPFLMSLDGTKLSPPVTLAEVAPDTYTYIYDTPTVSAPYILDPTAGPQHASVTTDNALTGTIAWTNPSFAAASDGFFATAVNTTGTSSTHYLYAQTFGFSIASTATISGIMVEILRKCSLIAGTTYCQDNVVSLINAGAPVGANYSAATSWPTTAAYASYGGDGSSWGITPMPTMVNDATFGTTVSCKIRGS